MKEHQDYIEKKHFYNSDFFKNALKLGQFQNITKLRKDENKSGRKIKDYALFLLN